MAKRGQHRESEAQDGRSERPATGAWAAPIHAASDFLQLLELPPIPATYTSHLAQTVVFHPRLGMEPGRVE